MKLFFKSQIGLLAVIIASSVRASEVKSILAPISTSKSANKEFTRPKLPSGLPPGGRRTGGGRRDTCPDRTPRMTALVPMTEEPATVKNVWGLTTEERPNFWFYVPYTKSDRYPAFFVLQNEKSIPIYQKDVFLPEQPGIISVSIPPNIPALRVNEQYRWFLKVYCEQDKQAPPVYVEGVVTRVNLTATINQQLKNARPLQRFAIYARNGIWYQALETLIQLKQQDPQNYTIQTNWKNLLTDIGLDEIVDKRIVTDESSNYDALSQGNYIIYFTR